MTESSSEFPFVWEGRSTATIGELLSEASRAEREGKATAFLTAYRAANPHADSNLGYIIGYMGPEDRQRMYAAYDLMHPVFGTRP